MHKVIFISESLKSAHGGSPVHVTADAQYDELNGELVVKLCDSTKSEFKVVRKRVEREEARDLAKDIFQSWIRGLVKQGDVCIEGA